MSIPTTIPAGEDIWSYVATDLQARDTESLTKQARSMKHCCEMEDAVQRRNNTNHPGWAGTCGRPTVGLIRIILLLRGAEVTF